MFCWSSAPCVALICRHQQAHSGYSAPQLSPIPTPVTNNPLWSSARLPSCPSSLISVPAAPRPPSCYLPESLPADLRYLLSSAANWSFVLSVLFCFCVCISQESENGLWVVSISVFVFVCANWNNVAASLAEILSLKTHSSMYEVDF